MKNINYHVGTPRQTAIVFIVILQTLLCSSLASFGQNLKVAIAANLQAVIGPLTKDFYKKTGIAVDVIPGASGNLATQVHNGAPFDLFLSADTTFPGNLYKSGDAMERPVVYAEGVLILCSSQKLNFSNWPQLLMSGKIAKVAIGNPVTAPYGKAAMQALKKEGIYDKLTSKIVQGESITQVNTYIATGAVAAGFTTLAFAKEEKNKSTLTYILVDPKSYEPILQGMVILKHAQNNPSARKFYNYILSADAKTIFEAYGYHMHHQ